METVNSVQSRDWKALVGSAIFISLNVLNVVLRTWFPQFEDLPIVLTIVILFLLYAHAHRPFRTPQLSIIDKN